MLGNIFISGITPIDAYPRSKSNKYYKQCIEKVDLCIPKAKPDIEDINEIQIKACIEKVKVINTVLGDKLVIEAKIQIKVIYTADNIVQSVHSAHWEIVFHEYVLLENIDCCSCNRLIRYVFLGIEDVCVICMDKRSLSLSIIFILCPQIIEDANKTNSAGMICGSQEYIDNIPLNETDCCYVEERNYKKPSCCNDDEKCNYDQRRIQVDESKGCRKLRRENEDRYCRGYARRDDYDFYKK